MQQKLRFKRKTYGWGWTPVTWQGWLCTLFFAIGIALVMNHHIDQISTMGDGDILDSKIILRSFIGQILLLVSVMIFICYKKGEKPRWQWGGKSPD